MMRSHDVGVIPIAENGTLLGLVTDRDLVVRVLAERKDPTTVTLRDVMTSSPVTVTPDMELTDARQLMAEHRIRRLPVMKGDDLVGIISLGDVAVALASKRAVGDALEEISESRATEPRVDGPAPGTPERARTAG
jgi:signal-transduction protein with cAMP-binding, CBS, and nucleotidyltransferase domain